MYAATSFWAFFWGGDTIAFWKISLLHWLTKVTNHTLYREKIIGEVLWRQWCHGDWTLKTLSEIAFCFILATGFKRFWYQLLLFLLSSLSLLLSFWLPFCSFCCYFCNCVGVLLVIIGVGVIVATIALIFVALLLLLHHCFVLFNTY